MPIIRETLEDVTKGFGFRAAVTILAIAIIIIVIINWIVVGAGLWLLSFAWPVFNITWAQTFPVSLAYLLMFSGGPMFAKGK